MTSRWFPKRRISEPSRTRSHASGRFSQIAKRPNRSRLQDGAQGAFRRHRMSAAGLIGTGTSVAQDGPPETTTIRLARIPSICRAPQYMTEELLRSEGFTATGSHGSRGFRSFPPRDVLDVAECGKFRRVRKIKDLTTTVASESASQGRSPRSLLGCVHRVHRVGTRTLSRRVGHRGGTRAPPRSSTQAATSTS
jgi:hypothetical protein